MTNKFSAKTREFTKKEKEKLLSFKWKWSFFSLLFEINVLNNFFEAIFSKLWNIRTQRKGAILHSVACEGKDSVERKIFGFIRKRIYKVMIDKIEKSQKFFSGKGHRTTHVEFAVKGFSQKIVSLNWTTRKEHREGRIGEWYIDSWTEDWHVFGSICSQKSFHHKAQVLAIKLGS